MAKEIIVKDTTVNVIQIDSQDYICITDMLKAKDGEFFIADWLRNRNTMEYLGIWESVYNPNFNYGEFAAIKSKAGLNNFKISVKEFVSRTNAIGIQAKAGRYGGTYAHKDIAFEFGMWISPEFKIYLIKEFQRLKENEQKALEWSAKRELAKVNYRIHTDAIKENIVPTLTEEQLKYVYADEADLLNMALFGKTAAQWRKENSDKKGNIRDYATIEQLLVIANMESYNAILIEQNVSQPERLQQLNNMARSQLRVLQQTSSPLLAEGKKDDNNN